MSRRGKGENSLEVNISIYIVGMHLECFHPSHPWTVGEEMAKSSLFCQCDTINESQNRDSYCKGLEIWSGRKIHPGGSVPPQRIVERYSLMLEKVGVGQKVRLKQLQVL